MTRLTTTMTTVAIATAGPSFADTLYRGYETPRYTVVLQDGPIEVRNYQSELMAQVEVQASQSAALRAGFRILAGYIFGGNVRADKIAMTSPVIQSLPEETAMTSPVTQTGWNGVWTVSFMMPHAYTKDQLPTPNNAAIQFVETQPSQRVSITFSGWATDARRDRFETALRHWANANGHQITGPAELAYFDAPMTLPWKRRNEISFAIR